MSCNREDAWTIEDDTILSEITISYIADGKTQLDAFETVAEKTGRTPAACGFRWNSFVRKKYSNEIKAAKLKRQKKTFKRNKYLSREISPSEVFKNEFELTNDYVESIDNMISILREHREQFKQIKPSISKELESINEDYRALLQIMDRARKVAFTENELR